MFWVVFVDEGGVLGCAVHVLGGFCGWEWCFGVCRPCFGRFLWTGVVFWCVVHVLDGVCFEAGFGAGFWVCLEGAILKNRGVGFVGDCCYLCMIYILSVVCLGVRES